MSQKIGNKKAQKLLSAGQKQCRRKRRTLPVALKGLMGEANLRFARGEVALASKMCMEIIRQVMMYLILKKKNDFPYTDKEIF